MFYQHPHTSNVLIRYNCKETRWCAQPLFKTEVTIWLVIKIKHWIVHVTYTIQLFAVLKGTLTSYCRHRSKKKKKKINMFWLNNNAAPWCNLTHVVWTCKSLRVASERALSVNVCAKSQICRSICQCDLLQIRDLK